MQTEDRGNRPPIYDSGWAPEIFGAVLTLSIIAFLIGFARGTV